MCLCDRDTCNGPSLPPQEMDDSEHIIDIDAVVREMNSEPEEPQPEAVSGVEGRHRGGYREVLVVVVIACLILSGG